MNYEHNRTSEKHAAALTEALSMLSARIPRYLALATVLLLLLCSALAWWIHQVGLGPATVILVVPPAKGASMPGMGRVVCFQSMQPYDQGHSDRCGNYPCDRQSWHVVHGEEKPGTTLAEFLTHTRNEDIVLSLVLGGHDSAPVIANPNYDSNTQLALQRARNTRQALAGILNPSANPTIAAAVADLTEYCRPTDGSPKSATPQGNPDEQRRSPLLLVVVRPSSNTEG